MTKEGWVHPFKDGKQRELEPKDLIAVDFDGVLTKGENYSWGDGNEQPNEKVCEWVREKYYDGCLIVVWTSRSWNQANVIAARLTEWGVPYHGIRCEKGGANLYIDDKAIRPEEI